MLRAILQIKQDQHSAMLASLSRPPLPLSSRVQLRRYAQPIRASMTVAQPAEEQKKDFDTETCWRNIWHTTEHSTRYSAGCLLCTSMDVP